MAQRTTIHDGTESEGDLHVDYEATHNRVFLHASSGGFNWCVSLTASEARKMSEALMKGAFLIEANTPSDSGAA